MNIEKAVAQHYASDNRAQKILEELGHPEVLTLDDLSPHDEFHIGGRPATEHFMALLDFKVGARILDAGCGIGGAARYLSSVFDVRVTGIDLTPEFIDVARVLTQKTAIENKPVFEVESVLSLPFERESFDGAYTIHAAMNIKDKAAFYTQVHRILKPGALFGIYDILAGNGAEDFVFPMPWANTKETSFLVSLDEIESVLSGAGFEILHKDNRRTFALSVMQKRIEKGTESEKRKETSLNLQRNLENDLCAPWELVCRKV